MTQRHEEQKRERRRAESVEEQVRLALASTQPASFHVEQVRAHERSVWISFGNVPQPYPHELRWHLERIHGHAIRAFVAMLREVLS